jgi:hypothetical protein
MILIEGGLDSFTLNLGGPITKKVEKHWCTLCTIHIYLFEYNLDSNFKLS